MGIDYEQDSLEKRAPSNEELVELAALTERQLELEEIIDATEKELSEYKKQLKTVSETSIPDLMQNIGMLEFTLANGYKVTIKRFYGANINDENREACFAWLRDHELDDIIKHEIVAKLGKDSDERAKIVADFLKTMNIDHTDKEFIHPMTLKAFIREQVEETDDFPKDLFKVYDGKLTKITRRK